MTIKMSLIDFLTTIYLMALVSNAVVTNVRPFYSNPNLNVSKSNKAEVGFLAYGVVTNLAIVMILSKWTLNLIDYVFYTPSQYTVSYII